jgi:hypothetical protein
VNDTHSKRRGGATRSAGQGGPSSGAWALPIVLAIVGLAAFLYYLRREEPAPRAPDDIAAPADVQRSAPPAPRPTPPAATPAPRAEPPPPALDASDDVIHAELTDALGQSAIQQFLVPASLVRHIVATVDNLPRSRLAVEQRPIKPAPGRFTTTGPEEAPVLSDENESRYTPFVKAVDAASTAAIVAIYRRNYPLFQQAYEELGYPQGDFNGRLIEVIDHLLATPDVERPIRLVRPNILYRYADEDLEARSAGQKLLIRMGPDNAAVIKGKLRELRTRLVADAPSP